MAEPLGRHRGAAFGLAFVISATTHIARLARAGFVFAREGVFGVVDPSLVPPPAQLLLKLARLIERPGAKSGPRLSRAPTGSTRRQVSVARSGTIPTIRSTAIPPAPGR